MVTRADVILAVELAIEIHDRIDDRCIDRQRDKQGFPYILHLFWVMAMGKTHLDQVVRVLHDAVEDHRERGVTLEYLRERGVPAEAIPVLDALTHRRGEPYDDYIARVMAAGPVAVRAKLDDLADNLAPGRLLLGEGECGEADLRRIRKYRRAYERLAAVGG